MLAEWQEAPKFKAILKKHYHADPTFDAVAAKEAKDCHGCQFKQLLFAREVCNNPHHKSAKLIRCHLYKRETSGY